MREAHLRTAQAEGFCSGAPSCASPVQCESIGGDLSVRINVVNGYPGYLRREGWE